MSLLLKRIEEEIHEPMTDANKKVPLDVADELNVIRGFVLAGWKVTEACMGEGDGARAIVTVLHQGVERLEALQQVRP